MDEWSTREVIRTLRGQEAENDVYLRRDLMTWQSWRLMLLE
ncbi:hypothetical protein [Pseudomonas sp. LFM046]|nr:hypothetical protein [Pseudomonas sp. LFM046]